MAMNLIIIICVTIIVIIGIYLLSNAIANINREIEIEERKEYDSNDIRYAHLKEIRKIRDYIKIGIIVIAIPLFVKCILLVDLIDKISKLAK